MFFMKYGKTLFVTQILIVVTQKYNIMVEFSNLVGVSLVGDMSGDFQFMADSFTFEPSPTEENGGLYWDCGKTFVIEKPADEVLEKFKVQRSAIVTLSALLGRGAKATAREYAIGTRGVPARVLIVQHLNKAKLIVYCKMLTDPLG